MHLRVIFGLLAAIALASLTQYAAVYGPTHSGVWFMSHDPLSLMLWYTGLALDHLSLFFHMSGWAGIKTTANAIAVSEMISIVAIALYYVLRDPLRPPHGDRFSAFSLPSTAETTRFARRGGPIDGWSPSLLVWACLIGVGLVFGGLFYENTQVTIGENWVPWVQDRTPYLLMLGFGICVIGYFATRERRST